MPLGIDFLQIGLHLFNIIILFGGLYLILYSPVKKFIKQREDHYKRMNDETEQALSEAKKIQLECEERLKGVEDEISAQRQEAYQEINALRNESIKEAKEEAQMIVSKAEEEAEKKRREIVDGAKDDIAGLISEAADKLLLDGDTGSFYDSFLEDAERGV